MIIIENITPELLKLLNIDGFNMYISDQGDIRDIALAEIDTEGKSIIFHLE